MEGLETQDMGLLHIYKDKFTLGCHFDIALMHKHIIGETLSFFWRKNGSTQVKRE